MKRPASWLPARLVALLPLAALCACAEEAPTGPPTIRLGRDECAECGMMIADERASAASLVRLEGHPEHLVWDDVGCLLDWEHKRQQDRDSRDVLERWVHDQETMAWIAAGEATFVVSESLHTPMASGIVAFSDTQRAEAARRRHGGVVVSFAELVEVRDRQMAARRRPAHDGADGERPAAESAGASTSPAGGEP